MRLVVTGGIGSGKSTALAVLREAFPDHSVFSVDDKVRALYDEPLFRAALLETFGECERSRMSDTVFSNPKARAQLTALASNFLHPHMAEAFSRDAVIIEFPLFFETGEWVPQADVVLALSCPLEERRQRVLARDKMTPEKFDRICLAQLSESAREALADVSVSTSGSREEAARRLREALPLIRQKALKLRCTQFFGTDAVWPIIEAHYSEPHRAYHTLEHISELLGHLDPVMSEHPNARALELACWFHDIIYVTKLPAAKNNEFLSARAMLSLLKQHAPHFFEAEFGQVALAAELILATRSHQVESSFLLGQPLSKMTAEQFLDADLSILASDPARFARYDQQIAFEWKPEHSGIAAEAYTAGRHKALAHFLDRPQLFYSEAFAHLEPAARANLSRLLG